MKPAWLMPRAWPLRVRVPLLVAVLMVIVGALASQLVLLRLERTQEAHLRALTSAYLDGIATAATRDSMWSMRSLSYRTTTFSRRLTRTSSLP
jgi:hypothetical protein